MQEGGFQNMNMNGEPILNLEAAAERNLYLYAVSPRASVLIRRASQAF